MKILPKSIRGGFSPAYLRRKMREAYEKGVEDAKGQTCFCVQCELYARMVDGLIVAGNALAVRYPMDEEAKAWERAKRGQ